MRLQRTASDRVTSGPLGETSVLFGYQGRQVALSTLKAGDSSQSELLDQVLPGSCAMAESESGQVPSTEGNVTIDLEADAKRWDFERHLRL